MRTREQAQSTFVSSFRDLNYREKDTTGKPEERR